LQKNRGVVKTLSKLLGYRIKQIKKADPQLVGAIGAALFAKEMALKKTGEKYDNSRM